MTFENLGWSKGIFMIPEGGFVRMQYYDNNSFSIQYEELKAFLSLSKIKLQNK